MARAICVMSLPQINGLMQDYWGTMSGLLQLIRRSLFGGGAGASWRGPSLITVVIFQPVAVAYVHFRKPTKKKKVGSAGYLSRPLGPK